MPTYPPSGDQSERHNHLTRDIKPQGQCPACDRHHRATRQGDTMTDVLSNHVETAAAYFKSGWDAAIREVALQRQHDRLDEFLEEQSRRALAAEAEFARLRAEVSR